MLIIDPQQDFCNKNGALFVTGADEDCLRTAAMIRRLETKIDAIHITLDSHNEVDIAHPVWWVDSNGNHPAPFTIITKDDVVNGKWKASHPACIKRSIDYVTQLENNKRYPLCIWPPHCIIGSNGYALEENVSNAVRAWSRNRFKKIDFVTKGSNPFTEHYSAVKADVPDPSDPTTLLNSDLISIENKADVILVLGQALSHCLANTVNDMIAEFGRESVKKLVIIRDCTSSVTGFENMGAEFLKEATALGVKVANSTTVLA